MMDRLQSGARPAMTRANGNRPLDDGGAPRSVRRPHRPLYRTGYTFRILGMGLSSLPVDVVLVQQQAGARAWAVMVLGGLRWPPRAGWSCERRGRGRGRERGRQ